MQAKGWVPLEVVASNRQAGRSRRGTPLGPLHSAARPRGQGTADLWPNWAGSQKPIDGVPHHLPAPREGRSTRAPSVKRLKLLNYGQLGPVLRKPIDGMLPIIFPRAERLLPGRPSAKTSPPRFDARRAAGRGCPYPIEYIGPVERRKGAHFSPLYHLNEACPLVCPAHSHTRSSAARRADAWQRSPPFGCSCNGRSARCCSPAPAGQSLPRGRRLHQCRRRARWRPRRARAAGATRRPVRAPQALTLAFKLLAHETPSTHDEQPPVSDRRSHPSSAFRAAR